MSSSQNSRGDKGAIWHPYTKWSAVQKGLPVIVRGEGPYLFDDQGKRYFDAVSTWWACSLGHGHPAVVAAIREQSETLQHSILGGLTHPAAEALARRLAALMPDPRRHVHYASDGASAVEAALKISIQYWSNLGQPEKKGFASLQGAYHGDTIATLSLGYLESFHKPFSGVRMPGWQLPVPPYGCSLEQGLEAAQTLVRAHKHELAALVVEPLCQGAAGMRVYPTAYLAGLDRICREHEVLLVADEVATGFHRTGACFAFEHAGIDPDIVCVGKALSAGYLPISATIVKDDIYDTFRDGREDHTFYHGHTFAGNPIATAAALAALGVYESEDMRSRVESGSTTMTRVIEPLSGSEGVADIRSLGMMAAVELADTARGGRGAERAQNVRQTVLEHGVLLRPLGPVVYLMPPLNTPPEVIQRVAQILKEAIVSAR